MTAESDLLTRWKKTVEFYEALRQGGAVAAGLDFSSKSLIQLTNDFEGMLGGTQFSGIDSDLYTARAQVASALKVAKTTFERHVFDYKAVEGFAGSTLDVLWPELVRFYSENDRKVASRGFTFGTPAAGGANVGSGACVRCNVDAFGNVREAQTADSKEARCERDASSGPNLQEEEFSIQSTTPEGKDALDEAGSGKISKKNFVGLSARTSTTFGIGSPSFSDADITNASLGSWSSNVTINGTNYSTVTDGYRGSFGDSSTLTALRCAATAFTISQVLTNPKFDLDTAYYRHVAVRRKSNADGTLTATLGRNSVSVDLSTLANDVWYLLKVTDKGCYLKNFGQENLTLSIARAGGTTGSVDLDDVTVGAFQEFDGGLYAFVGGAAAFQVDDTFTWTDATTAAGINQTWFWRVLGLFLPSCPVKPTAAPTAALAGTGAGNLSNGVYTYSKTWVDVNGVESGESATVTVTVVDHTTNGKVTVGRNETSPGAHIASWRVYRCAVGTGTPRKLVATVTVGTASYTDNTADGSLPATTPPTGVTFLDPP